MCPANQLKKDIWPLFYLPNPNELVGQVGLFGLLNLFDD